MDTQSANASPAGVIARLRSMLGGSSEASLTKRLAGTIFIIRVVSAALAYLFADPAGALDGRLGLRRLCLCLDLGAAARQHDGFGISASAQKIIPEYRARGEHALLRGFLSGSRWMTFAVSSVVSLLLAGVVKGLSPWIEANTVVPLYIGCLTLPAFVVAKYPGRHRALARLDAAWLDAAIHHPPVADHRADRRRLCTRAASRRNRLRCWPAPARSGSRCSGR